MPCTVATWCKRFLGTECAVSVSVPVVEGCAILPERLRLPLRSGPSYTFGVPRSGQWRVRLNTDWSGYDLDVCQQSTCDATARNAEIDGACTSPWTSVSARTARSSSPRIVDRLHQNRKGRTT